MKLHKLNQERLTILSLWSGVNLSLVVYLLQPITISLLLCLPLSLAIAYLYFAFWKLSFSFSQDGSMSGFIGNFIDGEHPHEYQNRVLLKLAASCLIGAIISLALYKVGIVIYAVAVLSYVLLSFFLLPILLRVKFYWK
ncbi:hypothetical protein [Neolewinella agarilytica]|uniref:Uncharacterized protein n=1 Tax=Neolewinella agarilytica TaxID=478744 RepID=A0A1H9M263_9BACT|nr:hypothetical protein [Neolewinella agarilytica]SER17575.1 hypothetical protein SAMN05444359_12682 [Neolewinella agarilytica]